MVRRTSAMEDLRFLLSLCDRPIVVRYVAGVLLLSVTETITAMMVMPFLAYVMGSNHRLTTWVDAALAALAGRPLSRVETITVIGAAGVGMLLLHFGAQMNQTAAAARFSSNFVRIGTRKLVAAILALPFPAVRARTPSSLVSLCTSQLSEVVVRCLLPILFSAGRVFAAAMACIVVFIFHPWLAAALFGGAAVVFGLSARFIQGPTRRLAEERHQAAAQRTEVVSQILRGFREVRVAGAGAAALADIDGVLGRLQESTTRHAVATGLTRPLVESGALALILLLLVLDARSSLGGGSLVPVLAASLFVLARALPPLAAFHLGFVGLAGSAPTIGEMRALLASAPGAEPGLSEGFMPRASRIELREVSVSGSGGEPILAGVSCAAEAGRMTAIVGKTGAGKSTLLDVILGLVPPDSGRVLIDGEPLTEATAVSWQRSIGFVPQQVLMIRGTVAQNVALTFGSVDPRDELAIAAALRAACLDPAETEGRLAPGKSVGAGGVEISGGELQRLGLARALYRRAGTLLLDEATSALDPATEKRVLETLRAVAGAKTVVMVTHRFSNLALFDRVILVESGRIVACGPPSEVMRDGIFQRLAATG